MSFDFEDLPLSDEIHFESEDTGFSLTHPDVFRDWIRATVVREGKSLDVFTFIFCSDEYLHKVNVEYLQHDTYTDIITFPLSDSDTRLESDIFISIDRIKENARSFNVPFEHELKRVIIHGVLHLCGYGDKTETEKEEMRSKEEEAIALFPAS